MDYKVYHPDNTFYTALAENNKFFKETLNENRNSRKKVSACPTERSLRPDTTSIYKLNFMPNSSIFSSNSKTFRGLSNHKSSIKNSKSVNNLSQRNVKNCS